MNVFPRDPKQKNAEVKLFIRQRYAWPGGYPMMLVLHDGEVLCWKCAKENARQILCSTRSNARDGWAAEGVDVNYEGDSYCAHCNDKLEAAYED
jgi:hypothetical protein